MNSFNELSIELTHQCNLDCIFCSSKGGSDRDIQIEISRVIEVIEKCIEKFNLNHVSLSGGEPLLHSNFFDLYNYLKQTDLDTLIYSSGVLSSSGTLKSISSNTLRRLENDVRFILNIQGHEASMIEKINRIPGSFEIIEESIDKIKEHGFELESHVVPAKHNYQNLEDIYQFCKRKDFDKISFLRFVPQGRGKHSNLYNNKKEFFQITQTLKRILKTNQNEDIEIRLGRPINFLFLTDNEELYKEENHYCRGGFKAPLILPNGDVSMCPAWKDLEIFTAGNIYEKNFEEIWNSEYFEKFRNFLNEGYKNLDEPCQSCEYIEECRGKCVAQRLLNQEINEDDDLEDIIYHAPDPQCFKTLIDQEEEKDDR